MVTWSGKNGYGCENKTGQRDTCQAAKGGERDNNTSPVQDGA